MQELIKTTDEVPAVGISICLFGVLKRLWDLNGRDRTQMMVDVAFWMQPLAVTSGAFKTFTWAVHQKLVLELLLLLTIAIWS